MVKQFLSQNGIGYEEKDVSRNRAYAQELVGTTGQMGVPVTVFDGEAIIGFDRARLQQLLPRMQAGGGRRFGASIADAAGITAKRGSITHGAYIGKVKPGSAAQKTGLVPGDIIIRVNRVNINSADDFERQFSRLKAGDSLELVFLRGGRTFTAETRL
jgi:S1-C subfamily serine protease